VCVGKVSLLDLGNTCVLTLYLEAALSFHNTVSEPRILAPYVLRSIGSVSVRTDSVVNLPQCLTSVSFKFHLHIRVTKARKQIKPLTPE
jgi:hypothetical protein